MTAPPTILSPQEFLEKQQRQALQQDKSLSPLAMEFGDILASGLLISLSEEQRGIIRDCQIAVGVLPVRQLDAFIQEVPSDHGRIICYSYGLMSFLIALNKILLSRVIFPYRGLEPTLEPEVALRRVKEAMDWFYHGAETFPRFTVDTTRTLIASTLAQTQAAFVIGHELGHAVARHLETEPADPNEARAREFEADERGFEMVLSSFRRRNDLYSTNELCLAQAGIDIAFTYLQFVTDYFRNTLVDPSHPSLQERRDHFRRRYGCDIPPQAKDLGDQAEKLFTWFGQNVFFIEDSEVKRTATTPGGNGPARRPRPEAPAASPLRQALAEIAELAAAAARVGF